MRAVAAVLDHLQQLHFAPLAVEAEAADEDLHFDFGELAGPRRGDDGRDGHVAPLGRVADRDHVDRHLQPGELGGDLLQAGLVVDAAVGEDDDALRRNAAEAAGDLPQGGLQARVAVGRSDGPLACGLAWLADLAAKRA